MGVLDFKGYSVLQMEYKRNDNFDPSVSKIALDPHLSEEHTVDNNNVEVKLHVTAGSSVDVKVPFSVSCSVLGKFKFNPDEDDHDFGIDTFITNNCVAILYPYVRAIISNLTAFSNEFPGYNMPTVNVSKVIERQKDSDR